EFFCGELIESEIAADGWEPGCVFAEALGFESALGEAAVMQVVGARVDLVEPALILPGAGSDVDPVAGEAGEGFGQPLAKTAIFKEATLQHGGWTHWSAAGPLASLCEVTLQEAGQGTSRGPG